MSIDAKTKENLYQAIKDKKPQSDIAKEFNLSKSTVSYHAKMLNSGKTTRTYSKRKTDIDHQKVEISKPESDDKILAVFGSQKSVMAAIRSIQWS